MYTPITIYTIKYNAVIKLGPTKSPNQKIKFPNVSLPFSNFVLLNAARGSWPSCIINKYPLTFPKRQNMTNSWTQAERKKVTKVAVDFERWKAEMEEW